MKKNGPGHASMARLLQQLRPERRMVGSVTKDADGGTQKVPTGIEIAMETCPCQYMGQILYVLFRKLKLDSYEPKECKSQKDQEMQKS